MKTDSMGVKEWIENYAFGGDRAQEFIRRKEGGFVVVTESKTYGTTRLLFTNEEGEVMDTIDQYFHGTGCKDFGGIMQLEDSSYVMSAAVCIHDADWDYHNKDVQIVKLDKEGNELWNRIFVTEYSDNVWGLVRMKDQGYVIAAEKLIQPSPTDYYWPHIFLTKTNCMGLLTEPEASFTYNNLGSQEGVQLRFVPPYLCYFSKFLITIPHLSDSMMHLNRINFSKLFSYQKADEDLNLKFIILLTPDSIIPLPHNNFLCVND